MKLMTFSTNFIQAVNKWYILEEVLNHANIDRNIVISLLIIWKKNILLFCVQLKNNSKDTLKFHWENARKKE